MCSSIKGQISTKQKPPLLFSSVSQSCPTLCNPMDCNTSGLPVHYQLPEFTQIQVHRIGDAIQPSHPLSSPSPPAFSLSQQHQGLFQQSKNHHYFCSNHNTIHKEKNKTKQNTVPLKLYLFRCILYLLYLFIYF